MRICVGSSTEGRSGRFAFVVAVCGLILVTAASADIIEGDTADASVRDNLDGTYQIADQGSTDAFVGNRGANNRCVIFVFELPTRPTGNIVDASATGLAFNLFEEHVGSGGFGTDLYGVRYNSSSTVITNDFFGGSLLQDDIITPTTAEGIVSTDSAGDAALATWINTQYTSGAGQGDFVFLKLIFDTTPATQSYDYQKVSMADNATPSNRPELTLNFTAIPEPASVLLYGIALIGLYGVRRRLCPRSNPS